MKVFYFIFFASRVRESAAARLVRVTLPCFAHSFPPKPSPTHPSRNHVRARHSCPPPQHTHPVPLEDPRCIPLMHWPRFHFFCFPLFTSSFCLYSFDPPPLAAAQHRKGPKCTHLPTPSACALPRRLCRFPGVKHSFLRGPTAAFPPTYLLSHFHVVGAPLLPTGACAPHKGNASSSLTSSVSGQHPLACPPHPTTS